MENNFEIIIKWCYFCSISVINKIKNGKVEQRYNSKF